MITYLELLEMVKDGNAPNRIAFEGILFERENCVYRRPNGGRRLSCFLWGSGEVYQALEKCIEILEDDAYYEELEEILKDAEYYEKLDEEILKGAEYYEKLDEEILKGAEYHEKLDEEILKGAEYHEEMED